MAASTTGDGFRAAILLLCAAWHQLPAGSLPNEDRQLSALAGYGRFTKDFLKIKSESLHGWTLCSDDRWYHPLMAEYVINAWREKLAFQERKTRRTEAGKVGAQARWGEQAIGGARKVSGHDGQNGANTGIAPHGNRIAIAPEHDGSSIGIVSEPHALEMATASESHPESMAIVSASQCDLNALRERDSESDRERDIKEHPQPLQGCVLLNDGDGDLSLLTKKPAASLIDPEASTAKRLRSERAVPSRAAADASGEALLSLPLPEWLPKDAWADFVNFRLQNGKGSKKLTLRAAELALKKLADLRAQGNDPVAVIENSIVSGWTGLFPVKERSGLSRPFQSAETNTGKTNGNGPRPAVTRL
jgi:hypothetical protein